MPAVREASAAIRASEALGSPYIKLAPGPGRPAGEVAAHQLTRIQGAMVQIVAERGYAAVKLRDLVEVAGVSTRAFYEHFESKEDCLLQTYDMVMQRSTRRTIAAQAEEPHWRRRLGRIFDEFIRGLESRPHAVRFALIGVPGAGPAALEWARRAEGSFEAMLGESLARAPGGVSVPPLVVEGIVAGVAHVVRARLAAAEEADLLGLRDELIEWVLCFPGKSATALAELDRQAARGDAAFEPALLASNTGKGRSSAADRALVLSSVTKLAIANGYSKLTVTRIRSGVKVSRVTFDRHFIGVEDCFLAALDQRADEALAQAARAQAAGHTWPGGIYRAMAAFCDGVAADPLLAGACLAGVPVAGPGGLRWRRRLAAAVAEQLIEGVPPELRPSAVALEASTGAICSLFHRHAIKDRIQQRRKVAATLSFMALAPVLGASAAIAAIRREQVVPIRPVSPAADAFPRAVI